MNIAVRVIPKSSRCLVKEEGDGLKVYLTSPAQDGRANAQLIEILADYLNIKKYQVSILKGEKSRKKIIKIDGKVV